MQALYALLADLVLLSHFAFVVFVISGLLLIVIGGIRNWHWVRNRRFRWLHLVAIAVVAAQAWLGVMCPLTTLEMWLRAEAGEGGYAGSFIQYWVGRLLYYRAPAWVFALAYTGFGVLVAWAWRRFPPRRRDRQRDGGAI